MGVYRGLTVPDCLVEHLNECASLAGFTGRWSGAVGPLGEFWELDRPDALASDIWVLGTGPSLFYHCEPNELGLAVMSTKRAPDGSACVYCMDSLNLRLHLTLLASSARRFFLSVGEWDVRVLRWPVGKMPDWQRVIAAADAGARLKSEAGAIDDPDATLRAGNGAVGVWVGPAIDPLTGTGMEFLAAGGWSMPARRRRWSRRQRDERAMLNELVAALLPSGAQEMAVDYPAFNRQRVVWW